MLEKTLIANKSCAKLKISAAQEMDEIAVKVIRQDTPDFVLPFKTIDIDGETEFRYELGDGMPLEYLPSNMTKSELLILLENMLRPLKECNDWLLDYHNFHFGKEYIIVGKDYLNVKYVYIPAASFKKTDAEILAFFEEVVWNIKLTDEPMYIMDLCRRLRDKQTTLFTLLEYVSQELGGNTMFVEQPVVQESQTGNFGQVIGEVVEGVKRETKKIDTSFLNKFGFGNNTSNQQTVAPAPEPVVENVVSSTPAAGSEFGKEDVQSNLINNLFGEEEQDDKKKKKEREKQEREQREREKKERERIEKEQRERERKERDRRGGGFSLFGGGRNTEKVSQPVQQNANPASYHTPAQQQASPYVAPAGSSGSETQIFNMDDFTSNGNKLMLQLEDDGGYPFPRTIELDFSNKNYFVIGRYDKSGIPQADYNFEAAFSFISRRHLRIEKNGEQFTVVDLGSGNGSMLNNDVLVPNMPYVVKEGDRIVFSKQQRISYRVR